MYRIDASDLIHKIWSVETITIICNLIRVYRIVFFLAHTFISQCDKYKVHVITMPLIFFFVFFNFFNLL